MSDSELLIDNFDPSTNPLLAEALGKSKIDKNQARRLKMPKRNRSAYFLFSMEVRLKLKNEKEQLTPLETQAKVSQHWKELSAAEREKYEQMAKDEKQEYIAAMDKFYSNLTPETLEKSKSNRPKKPCSAYAHFVRDIKIKLKEENPKLIMQEILHIVSEKWRNLDKESREKYESRANADKEEYMSQIKKINEENAGAKKRKQSGQSAKSGRKKSQETEFDWENELPVNKQLKGDSMPLRVVKNKIIKEVSQFSHFTNKNDTSKDNSTVSTVSMSSKASSEGSHDLSEKIKPLFMPRPIIDSGAGFEKFAFKDGPQAIEIPKLDESFLKNGAQGAKTEANLLANLDQTQLSQLLLARMSLANMTQNNRSMEETILRKLLEVKTLQAQRFLMATNLLMSGNNNNNNGCF